MIAEAGEWIIELLEQSSEELEDLWPLRLEAWRSPAHDARSLARLDERLEAHMDALVLAAEEAMPVLRGCLDVGEKASALSAACVLLRMDDDDFTRLVFNRLKAADGEALDGLRLALRYSPPHRHREALDAMAEGSSERHAAAAVSTLAFHGQLDAGGRSLDFIRANDSYVRWLGWDAVAMLGHEWFAARGATALRTELSRCVAAALHDPHPAVRRAALEAAAWTRQEWILPALRELCSPPSPARYQELRLLAILGGPVDLPHILAAGADESLGPDRWRLLGAFGHPGVVESLITAMERGGPAEGAVAAAAFHKVTGVDVETGRRVALPPGDASEEDEDSEVEVHVPDPELARAHWRRAQEGLSGAVRCLYGFDITRGVADGVGRALDLESRLEQHLRSCFEAGGSLRPADLERFPAPSG